MQVRSPSPLPPPPPPPPLPDNCHDVKEKLFRPWASRLSRQVVKSKRLDCTASGHGRSHHQLVLPVVPIRTLSLDGPTSTSTSTSMTSSPSSSTVLLQQPGALPASKSLLSGCHVSGHCPVHRQHHQRHHNHHHNHHYHPHHHQFLVRNLDSNVADAATRLLKKQRPKRFQCPHCHVAFSNNGQLKGHVRIHTGERPFKCDNSNCGKSFTRNEELTRHKRIHSGLRPYTCPLCTKRFGRKDHLKKHIKTHQQKTSTMTMSTSTTTSTTTATLSMTSDVHQHPLSVTAGTATATAPSATTMTTATTAAMMMLPYRHLDSATTSCTDVAFMAAIQQSFPVVSASSSSSSSSTAPSSSMQGLAGPIATPSYGFLHASLQPECPIIFW